MDEPVQILSIGAGVQSSTLAVRRNVRRMSDTLKAPFPWFGGKLRCAHLVWQRFGDVPNYVEPFFGSGAVLLGRPFEPRIETVNDKDCFLANFWRAVQQDPKAVAHYADSPINEADLHARHRWLVRQDEWRKKMMDGENPDFCDAKIAGWWVWGICQWIGSGWCSRPDWTARNRAGGKASGIVAVANKRPRLNGFSDVGVHAKRPDLKRGYGKGVHRLAQQIPHLGDAGKGIHRTSQQIPCLRDDGKGIHRTAQQIPHLGDAGNGIHHSVWLTRPDLNGIAQGMLAQMSENLLAYFAALQDRLRRVRVCCGEWDRILGPSPTWKIGLTGVFLDPPYSDLANRDKDLYANDSLTVAHEVREWAIANGDNKLLRIALCGYEGEHVMPADWECVPWKAVGGYANTNGDESTPGAENCRRERIWFSPHCLPKPQPELFENLTGGNRGNGEKLNARRL